MTDHITLIIERARTRRTLPTPEERRRLRLLVGLTQADVAEAIGVSRPSVTRWERGRTPRGPALDRYAQLLQRLKEVA